MKNGEALPKSAVESKIYCYSLYERGIFGNKALTWNSFSEILDSSWKGQICIRHRKVGGRGKVKYDLDLKNAQSEINSMLSEGVKAEDISFNQSMPNKSLLIQGELMRTENGLYLLYSDVKKPMNLALKERSLQAAGLGAKFVLENNLNESSLADIYALLDLFPDSVVEFSSYACSVGNIPGRNTVIWEVRNY
jgi:hypothetical protein